MVEIIKPPLEIDARDRKDYVFHETLTRKLVVAFLKGVFPLVTVREIHGVENLPATGPVVLAPNHLTNFDVFPIQLCLPRPLFFMAKAELHQNPLMDAFIRQLGAFPVVRGAQDDWALNHARKVLAHQQVLAIFPEGKRSRGRGLQPAKTGAAHFAKEFNCPLVPVAVSGTERMFWQFPKRTDISVTIGEPLLPERNESAQALTDRLMFTIAAMLPPELRGVYAD